MTNLTILNNFSFMKYAERSVLGLADVGVPHGKKFQMTNTILNNSSFMKYAERSVPGLADVGVPHGDGDCPRAPAQGS